MKRFLALLTLIVTILFSFSSCSLLWDFLPDILEYFGVGDTGVEIPDDGDGVLTQLFGSFGQLRYAAGAVKKAELAMNMKMNKSHGRPSFRKLSRKNIIDLPLGEGGCPKGRRMRGNV